MRLIVAFGLSAALFGGISPGLAAVPPPTLSPALEKVTLAELNDQLQAAIDAEDYPLVRRLADTMIRHSDFGRLPDQASYGLHALVGLISFDEGDYEQARRSLRLAVEHLQDSADVWSFLIQAEFVLDDEDAGARTLARALEYVPEITETFGDDAVRQVLWSRRLNPEVAFDLRAALLNAGWDAPFTDILWLQHIDALIERGDLESATILLTRIEDGDALVRLLAERRYEGLIENVDIDLAYARELESIRLRADHSDADLGDRQSYGSSLFRRARFEEALSYIDDTLANASEDERVGDEILWLLDTRARALMELGRRDEAIAQQIQTVETASSRPYGDTVSFAINLGWFNLRLGRPVEALAAVADLDTAQLSPFGQMQAAQVRACGGWLSGDASMAEEAITYMREHWRDAPGALQYTLACRGDMEGLGELWLARFSDKDLVSDAISEFHDFIEPPSPTDFDRVIMNTYRESQARPEVRAAFDTRARVIRAPVLAGQF